MGLTQRPEGVTWSCLGRWVNPSPVTRALSSGSARVTRYHTLSVEVVYFLCLWWGVNSLLFCFSFVDAGAWRKGFYWLCCRPSEISADGINHKGLGHLLYMLCLRLYLAVILYCSGVAQSGHCYWHNIELACFSYWLQSLFCSGCLGVRGDG